MNVPTILEERVGKRAADQPIDLIQPVL